MDNRTEITAEELAALLEQLDRQYGYDFSQYAHPSLIRRTHKFMSENDILSVKELQLLLMREPAVFQQLLDTLTVNVTEMFRDPSFFRAVRDKVLPALADCPAINIWHAGCSTGEEVFSMSILLQEAGLLQRARLYATDINPINLDKARSGMIRLTGMKTNTANYYQAGGKEEFADYYTAMYDHALFKQELRNRVIFMPHNLVTDRSFNEFQLIFCRNVMIYFDRYLQNKVVDLLYASLAPSGFLALGMKETLLFSGKREKMETVSDQVKLFRKKE
ncbi:CheR family methyltransferase [Sediminibacterium ginsengisoli]|uniref:MCP methyltransferase, CheR-type n=1 Tax=Sediminibacterium ginsengisoli TaxID=413434 RepID=A0A1T4JZK5_9BACT|nr:protein-glutamate O-methyltransferase CheR [Sediminibacterium ginsengisoli]SJZ35549.1 MCP methyltransferase, CheR-type [Sediminibacterium ginsengisoli]